MSALASVLVLGFGLEPALYAKLQQLFRSKGEWSLRPYSCRRGWLKLQIPRPASTSALHSGVLPFIFLAARSHAKAPCVSVNGPIETFPHTFPTQFASASRSLCLLNPKPKNLHRTLNHLPNPNPKHTPNRQCILRWFWASRTASRSNEARRRGSLGFTMVKKSWAWENHTLILFSERNHYEIQVYTFFS